MAASPEYLDWLISFLKKKDIDMVSMDEVRRRLLEKDFRRRFVAITFDDGYADNLTYGLPIFEKHNVPFIIYVSLNLPNHSMIRWWDMLEDKLVSGDEHEFKFPNSIINIKAETISEKIDAWWQVRNEIIAQESKLSRAELLGLFGLDEEMNERFTQSVALSFSQTKELAQHPLVTIGTHTVNHLPLKKLELAQAEREILDSKIKLEEVCGQEIKHFAYPYGSPNECGEREFGIAERYEFETGVTFQPGNLFPSNANHLFSLPRYAGGDYVSEEKLSHIINGVKHFSEHY